MVGHKESRYAQTPSLHSSADRADRSNFAPETKQPQHARTLCNRGRSGNEIVWRTILADRVLSTATMEALQRDDRKLKFGLQSLFTNPVSEDVDVYREEDDKLVRLACLRTPTFWH